MPADNSAKPNTVMRTVDFKSLVEEIEDLNAPHPSYQFSKKTFKETDSDGVYNEVE